MSEKLFTPDIFSNSVPRFTKSDATIEQLLKNIVTKYYPQVSSQFISVEQFQGNEINSNNYKVTTTSGIYLIKKFITLNEFSKLEKTVLLNDWLNTNNVKIGKIYTSNTNKLIIKNDIDNSFWSIFDFIDGHFFTGESDDELISVAKEVGTLFEKLQQTPIELFSIDKVEHLKNTKQFMDKMESNNKNWSSYFGTELSSTLMNNWEFLKNLHSNLIEHKELLLSDVLVPSHIDLHPHNILVSENKLKSILDIDSIKLDNSLIPIAFSMYKLLKQCILTRGIENNPSEITRVSKIYFDSLITSFSVSDKEIKNLYLFAATEIFRRISIIFFLNLYENNTSWNHVLAIHLNGLKEAEIIFNGLISNEI